MTKKVFTMMILSIIFFIIVFFEFDVEKSSNNIFSSKESQIEGLNLLNKYKNSEIINKDVDKFWEINTKVTVVNKNTDSSSKINIKKENNKNIICINNNCYKLVGIKKINDNFSVDLVTPENKIKEFKINDILESDILITNISNYLVEFKIKDSEENFKFEIFQVDKDKYKPKEKKE